ncbi:glycosyltransferase family 1 protein [Cellulomonas cellasea]|uniref:Glycosyltransferase involved in cell wall biosynthesis n=1 Tax=Cellulomonas cellasea TaxID=43670 RepID=A0A7W4YBV7_9CELL|nr:glycosyltransferase family 1 protein [Cellulomonas cellasea]MBB2922886.1 glycosyltransferase involved in cell wall biosynthesis [Cellulomonas cellasea]
MRTFDLTGDGPTGVTRRVDEAVRALPDRHPRALVERMGALTDALGEPAAADPGTAGPTGDGTAHALERLREVLDPRDRSAVWLTLAVLGTRLPTDREVLAASRRGMLDGPLGTVHAALDLIDTTRAPEPVRIATGEVVVDVHNTARTTFFTGIQRVARECARRWARDHPVTLIGWTDELTCPVELQGPGLGRLVDGAAEVPTAPRTRVVPWRSEYLIPELAAERPRTERLHAMAAYTTTSVGAIGFDLVPLTSSETAIAGLPAEFAGHLAAAGRFSRIGTISEAAAQEYRGWRTMLGGAGLPGPDIRSVFLAAEVVEPTAEELAASRDRLMIADLPMVLCVGSHEPRKNHMAVLQAAEDLWRKGHQFSLTFIGGNSWNSDRFHHRVTELQNRNRPVETISGADDSLLFSAYRLARFTVFPSLNEGFGLPVAESLASGTPVITSDFGSMLEIAADGGALLVDPRDDQSISRGMETLLQDDAAYARLRDEASRRDVRAWDAYAAELWDYFLDDAVAPA